MKILYVYGDDYTALKFEQSQYDENSIAKMIENGEDPAKLFDFYIEFDLYKFNEIDSSFVDFIRNEIQNYDDSKHNNFYVVED